jgi:hypothetical protein
MKLSQRIYFFRRFQLSEFTFKDNQAEAVGLIINVFMLECFIMLVYVEWWMYSALGVVTVLWFWSRRDTRNVFWRIRQSSYPFLDMRDSRYLVWRVTEFSSLLWYMKYARNLKVFMFWIFLCINLPCKKWNMNVPNKLLQSANAINSLLWSFIWRDKHLWKDYSLRSRCSQNCLSFYGVRIFGKIQFLNRVNSVYKIKPMFFKINCTQKILH